MNANNGGNWDGGNQSRNEELDGDLSKVVALLNGMPRVAAPKDFDARLMARIAEAKAEEREFGGLRNLLADLPVAAAPADFDFKLRARLAQARSAENVGFWAKISASLSETFGGLSFSMAQASAALLIVGAIASGVTYKYLATPSSNRLENIQIASGPAYKDTAVASNGGSAGTGTAVPGREVEVPVRSVASHPRAVAVRTVSYNPSPAADVALFDGAQVSEPAGAEVGAVMIKHSGNGSTRMVGVVSYGMQNAAARQSLSRPSREDLSTQVF